MMKKKKSVKIHRCKRVKSHVVMNLLPLLALATTTKKKKKDRQREGDAVTELEEKEIEKEEMFVDSDDEEVVVSKGSSKSKHEVEHCVGVKCMKLSSAQQASQHEFSR